MTLFMIALPACAADGFEEQQYRKVGDVSLSLRVYKPQEWKASDKRPAIVFFFGGGWANGSTTQFHEHCLHLAGLGMVAMAADYRVSSRHQSKPGDSVQDALAAIRWVRRNADKLGVDPRRVAAGGGSAGGHLAAATAAFGKGPEVPDALVLFNPALDLLAKESYRTKWDATEAEFKAISPLHHVTRDLPPTVIFHGTKDDAVPFQSIEAFVAKAKKLGVQKVVLHSYAERPHGFFNFGRGDGMDYRDTVRKMDRFLNSLGWVKWKLTMLRRARPGGDGNFLPATTEVAWDPKRTAMVIVDMWDDHHCVSAAKRVVEMAPHMNATIKAARERGVLIVHAPSDCAKYYEKAPQRRAIDAAPMAKAEVTFRWNYFNPEREGPLAEHLEKGGCSCDTPEPCSPSKIVWTRQIAALEMTGDDAVSSNGQEIYNLFKKRGIENVVIMGVHTNRCVLGRPFGIRQMVYLGMNVVLCRDLTDSYHRDPGKHFEGLDKIVQHVEKYWCPTITSASIGVERPFQFKQDAN